MSRNREGQWIQGNYIRPGGAQRSRVEISDDEDDEITEIKQQSSSDTACSDRTSRFRIRRQKREAAQEVKFSGGEEINEEWEQLQQVIKLSKLEAEKQEERRKMCGTLQDVMNLQVEIEPLNSSSLKNQNKRNKTAVGNERDQREDSASPELFSTPPEDQGISDNKVEEKVDSDAEFPDSPSLPVNMRSPNAGNSNDRQRKELPSSTAQPSQQAKDTKRKFKLRRTRQEESSVVNKREKIGGDDEGDDNDDDDDEKVTVLENDKEKPQNENLEVDKDDLHGEKRTLQSVINDDDDVTDDEDPVPSLRKRVSLKRQKLTRFLEDSDSEDVKDVAKRGSKRASDKLSDPIPKRVAVDDFDKEKTRKDESISSKEKQNSSLSSAQPPSVRFSREYKKPKYRPTTVKEIMKAEVYIAPPGFNIPSYTKLIIRMLDRYRKRLQIAQSKVKVRLPWGHPVVAGSNSKTLELRMPGKASVFSFLRGIPQDATGTSVKNNSDSDVSYRRRTLRSSAKPTTQAATSTSTSTTTHETSYKVDSDSDGDELLKTYLDDVRPKPSVITSSKKASLLPGKDSSSASGSVDQQNLQPKDDETSSVKKQMSSKSNLGLSNDGKTTKSHAKIKTADTNISVQNGNSDVLFGAGVILDANASELQSNTFGASVKSLGKDSNAIKDFKTSESKVKDKKEGTKEVNQPDNQTNKGDAISMEVDENQADNIQPSKRRSILRPLDDDSTDDERDMSQPIFSLHRTKGDTSVDVDGSKEEKGSKLGEPVVDADNVALLDSQSILTQSGSQENLGKSILDTLTNENQGVMKPELLSNNSSTEGFTSTTKRTVKREGDSLTIDLDSEDSQNARQKRSEAADKAAAAAERRQRLLTRGQPPRDAPSSSSFAAYSVNEGDAHKESTVECPLCYRHFPSSEIQTHASDCQGPPSPPSQASYSQTEREMAGTSGVTSPGPCAIYRTLSGERGQLKNLKVFLQRSPLAERKILEKANQPPESGKKNLDFEKNVSPSGQTGKIGKFKGFHQSSAEGARKHTRTTRAAVRTESESERSGYEREVDEEVCSWLDSSSPEKKRPQKTYGGNTSKPYGDYIPLETSRQSDDDRIIKSSSSKSHEENQTTRTEEIESCSSSSDDNDDGLMVQYGAQRVSRGQKTGSRKEEKQETDENELALEQLGGWKKKRPLSSSKSSKPRKSRRLRDSDSEDSDESTILCAMCEERIPKESYEKHAEEELEERKRTGGAPRKVEVVTAKDSSREGGRSDHRRVGRQERTDLAVPLQSSGAECSEVDDNEDFDWDAVSDSPIKCFQFTENCTSGVDFQNQFEHLKKEKSGRRRGNQERYKGSDTRRGYGQYDNRGEHGSSGGGSNKKGHYRGSYNKVHGRGRRKKYSGNSRGYRGGKK